MNSPTRIALERGKKLNLAFLLITMIVLSGCGEIPVQDSSQFSMPKGTFIVGPDIQELLADRPDMQIDEVRYEDGCANSPRTRSRVSFRVTGADTDQITELRGRHVWQNASGDLEDSVAFRMRRDRSEDGYWREFTLDADVSGLRRYPQTKHMTIVAYSGTEEEVNRRETALAHTQISVPPETPLFYRLDVTSELRPVNWGDSGGDLWRFDAIARNVRFDDIGRFGGGHTRRVLVFNATTGGAPIQSVGDVETPIVVVMRRHRNDTNTRFRPSVTLLSELDNPDDRENCVLWQDGVEGNRGARRLQRDVVARAFLGACNSRWIGCPGYVRPSQPEPMEPEPMEPEPIEPEEGTNKGVSCLCVSDYATTTVGIKTCLIDEPGAQIGANLQCGIYGSILGRQSGVRTRCEFENWRPDDDDDTACNPSTGNIIAIDE